MIKHAQALSMAEASEFVNKRKDEGKEIAAFIKKFTKIKPKEAKEMRKKLESLEIIKLGEQDISKIIDLMPENSDGLGKIFTGIGLDEDETKKVLEIVREFK